MAPIKLPMAANGTKLRVDYRCLDATKRKAAAIARKARPGSVKQVMGEKVQFNDRGVPVQALCVKKIPTNLYLMLSCMWPQFDWHPFPFNDNT